MFAFKKALYSTNPIKILLVTKLLAEKKYIIGKDF